jgi:hypothetical protein
MACQYVSKEWIMMGETRMPLQRMPFGLVDYNIKYFSSHSSQKLKMEDHYAKWLETMYAHFGHKWLCLFRGPYWQYEEVVNPESAYDLPFVNFILIIDLEEFEFSAMDEESNNIVEEESIPSCNLTFTQSGCDIEMSNSLPTEQCLQQVEVCVSPEAMEVHHKIQPQQSNRKPVNSCLYDTMKVCLTT